MPTDPSIVNRFDLFRAKVLRHERIAGLYILAAALTNPRPAGTSLDLLLRSFAAPFGFREPDVGEAEWAYAEVFREDARSRIVESLVGGTQIGHSRWDVPPAEAEALADEFLALFGEDARFFCDKPPTEKAQSLAPYGRPDFSDFIFGGGCVAVDGQLAAIFWILDND